MSNSSSNVVHWNVWEGPPVSWGRPLEAIFPTTRREEKGRANQRNLLKDLRKRAPLPLVKVQLQFSSTSPSNVVHWNIWGGPPRILGPFEEIFPTRTRGEEGGANQRNIRKDLRKTALPPPPPP